ncbi:hypothetical protein MTO96_014776 [Rhipicephalus appendiculatus]
MLRRGRTLDASGLRKYEERRGSLRSNNLPRRRHRKENTDRQKSAAGSAVSAHSGAAAGSRAQTDKDLTAPVRLAAAREETGVRAAADFRRARTGFPK